MEGDGDLGGRKEREEMGGSIRNWRRCERGTEGQEIKQKYVAGGDKELGIDTGGSQTPGKRESPRTQWEQV